MEARVIHNNHTPRAWKWGAVREHVVNDLFIKIVGVEPALFDSGTG